MSQAMMNGQGNVAGRLIVEGRTISQGVFGRLAIVLGIVGLAVFGGHSDVPVDLAAASYSGLAARAEVSDLAAAGQIGNATLDVFLGGPGFIFGILALLRQPSRR